MKKIAIIPLMIIALFLSACGGDDSGLDDEIIQTNLGSFLGSLQVSDDPLTNLGRVFNARITVLRDGSDATIITATGDLGFNREFVGTAPLEAGGAISITLLNQTEPTDANIGGTAIIIGNELTINIDTSNDLATVREEIEDTESFEISGNLSIIGTNFIRE